MLIVPMLASMFCRAGFLHMPSGTKLNCKGTLHRKSNLSANPGINEPLLQFLWAEMYVCKSCGAANLPTPCHTAASSGEAKAYRKNCGDEGVSA